MKTLGLLGGMTHPATSIYYSTINRHIQRTLGGSTSASLLLHSFNHAETSALFTSNAWPQLTHRFVSAGRNLKISGADALVICCNVGHRVAGDVEKQVGLPVLHVVDYTAKRVRGAGVGRVALLGTETVMDEDGFFVRRLREKGGVEVVVPGRERRRAVQRLIFDEVGAGVFHPGQRDVLVGAVEETREMGAEAVVFACTDLQFVLTPEEVGLPCWDTMEAHALGVAEWALEGDGGHGTKA